MWYCCQKKITRQYDPLNFDIIEVFIFRLSGLISLSVLSVLCRQNCVKFSLETNMEVPFILIFEGLIFLLHDLINSGFFSLRCALKVKTSLHAYSPFPTSKV